MAGDFKKKTVCPLANPSLDRRSAPIDIWLVTGRLRGTTAAVFLREVEGLARLARRRFTF